MNEQIIKILIPIKLIFLDTIINPKIIKPITTNNGLTISGKILCKYIIYQNKLV